MDIAVVVLLIVIVGMLATVLAVLLRGRTTGDEASIVPVPSPPALMPTRPRSGDEPLVDVVRSADGGFHVLERLSGKTVLDMRPASLPADRPGSKSSTVPANATFLAGLSGIGIDVATALKAGTEYVVRFTPQVQKMLDTGSAALMQTARESISVEVSRSTGPHPRARDAGRNVRAEPSSGACRRSHRSRGSGPALSNPGCSRSHREATR
jgi:hypothetical protein